MKLLNVIFPTCLVVTIVFLLIPGILTSQNRELSSGIIKIGLLIPDNKSIEAKFGAALAIQTANERGGINGQKFQLVTRSMEGPWGTGSKQAVSLIFDEEVWAIMGSHDGRNAHLVEQVTTKTRMVFLSAWASDATLSQAFVPWYFSCVPNDNQQALALTDEIYKKRKITKIATVSDTSYDSKLALESFLKEAKANGNDPTQLFYTTGSNEEMNMLIKRIHKSDIKGIVLLGMPSVSLRFIEKLRQNKMDQPIFGTLSLLGEDENIEVELGNYENMILMTSVNWSGLKGISFKKEFQKKYNKLPGTVAAYAYDGMNAIIEAIRKTGLNKEKMQEAMSKVDHEGITGPIQFDDKGNRLNSAQLVEMTNKTSVKFVN
jgi:branched-chain amino acid transport system substrate-binding protein